MTHVLNPELDESGEPRGVMRKAAPGAMESRPASALVGADSATDLLRIAVEKGATVEQLNALVDLHERMEARQARKLFAEAMRKFQAECPSIRHERTAKIATRGGSEYSYTYAELDVIAKTVNPILAKHGLSYRWNAEVEASTLKCSCVVSHEGGHEAPPATISLPVENPSAMSPQQKVGAALTFARRQTLSMALGLTTTDDDPDAGDNDPTTISEDQITTIEDLIVETKANKPRFLEYLGVKEIAHIRQSRYAEAVAALEQKRGRK
jgi:hypothetical protein